jgi:hypothetical protein
MVRRALAVAVAALCLCAPVLAHADGSIAGQWNADMGHGKFIAMTILADNYWLSEDVENGRKVGQMAGSYEQKKTGDLTGELVFTPDMAQTHTSADHGAAKVETDKYTLSQDGHSLRLTSTGGSVMEFHKQTD